MLISISPDRYGGIEIIPPKRERALVERYLRTVGADASDACPYFQGDAAEGIIADLPPRARKALREGWDVRVRMGEWEFRMMVGHDAADGMRAPA